MEGGEAQKNKCHPEKKMKPVQMMEKRTEEALEVLGNHTGSEDRGIVRAKIRETHSSKHMAVN